METTAVTGAGSVIGVHLDAADTCLVARDIVGQTPVHLAAMQKFTDTLEALLAAGANPNAGSKRSWMPLHLAAGNYVGPVRILLAAGADPNARDYSGAMPLHIAAESGHEPAEIIECLVDKGAELDAQDEDGLTPLHFAARSWYAKPEVIETLLDAGANPRLQSESGAYPADFADNNPKFQGHRICQTLRQHIDPH